MCVCAVHIIKAMYRLAQLIPSLLVPILLVFHFYTQPPILLASPVYKPERHKK